MSDIRKSQRLAEKRARTADAHPTNNSSRRSTVGSQNNDDRATTKPSKADSRKGSSSGDRATSVRTRRSEASSRRCVEIETEIKKKEIEQEVLKKQQEILDLQLAMKLAQMEMVHSDSDGSVVSQTPDLPKWVQGENPWNDYGYEAKEHQVCANTANSLNSEKKVTKSHTCKRPCQNDEISKLMTRHSISKDLPIFNGDPTEWPNFIQQYRTSTNICNFTNEENQCRLQKCLKGNAKKIVQSLLILPQNVDKVIDLLEKRFGRPEHIISLLLDRVRKYSNIRDDRLDTLIEFSDEVKNLVATIEALGEEDHLRNPLLLQELLNKLPTSQKLNWIQYISGRQVSHKLVEFSLFMVRQKANAACQLRIPQVPDQKYFNDKKPKFRSREV